MTTPDDMGNGPVIRDHRRIDPVTGQVRRGKHAASQPAGTSGADRPGGAPGGPGGGAAGPAGGPTGGAAGPTGGRHGRRPDDPEDPVDSRADSQADAQEADEAETTEAVPEQRQQTQQTQQTRPTRPSVSDGTQSPEAAKTETAKAPDNLKVALAERTADLQRVQAEYANYRKRVERDRAAVKEAAVASVLSEFLPVLDAIGQAREHGELSGGFKSVADSLLSAVGKLGLVTYGERGEPFDPKVHEALTHMYSSDVAEDTCVDILQPGYRVGERILRPARVAVAEPADDQPSDGGDGN